MKTIKIGYINCDTKNDIYYSLKKNYITFINNNIINLNDKLQLDFNVEIIDDYTKEKCDLVIYEQNYYIYDKIINHSAFNNAIGNPIFLLTMWLEPHNWPTINTLVDNKIAYDDRNIFRTIFSYIPYHLKWYSFTSYENSEHNLCSPYCIITGDYYNLHTSRQLILKNKHKNKNKFCSMIFSHGTEERELIYNELNKYKKIDCFGNYHKNTGIWFYSDKILNKLMPKYKFNICFENCQSDYNEFYVTEKICNAFKWGTIPIYWGNNKQIYKIFNKKSFINLTGVPKNEWLNIIKEYDNNSKLYNDMLNEEPLIDYNIHDKYFAKKDEFIIKILSEF